MRIDLEFEGHKGFVLLPENRTEKQKWIWRAEFFEAFDYADRALHDMGYARAYIQVSDMYGCPEAVRLMKGFHDLAVKELDLCEKTVLFGFSRGGLYSVNYALSHPEDIACLYLDAPVLDIKSWPGGFGKGHRTDECWQECLDWYHLTEETAMTFSGNPLDNAADLAKKGVPVMIVAGDADTAVPIDENTLPFQKAFTAAGGELKLIVKPGCEHHPHSLEQPQPIVDFITEKYPL